MTLPSSLLPPPSSIDYRDVTIVVTAATTVGTFSRRYHRHCYRYHRRYVNATLPSSLHYRDVAIGVTTTTIVGTLSIRSHRRYFPYHRRNVIATLPSSLHLRICTLGGFGIFFGVVHCHISDCNCNHIVASHVASLTTHVAGPVYQHRVTPGV